MKKMIKLHRLLMAVLAVLLLAPFALSAAAGFESLFHDTLYSRGMMLYYAAFVLLIAVPFLNRYLAIIAVYFIMFSLSRGLMRITGEQDLLKAIFSGGPGLELGIKVALPVFAVALLWAIIGRIFTKMKFSVKHAPEEILERINKGRRKGKTLEEIEKELQEEGIKTAEIQAALQIREEGDK